MPPKKVTQHGAANSAKTVTSSNVTNNPVRQPKQTAMKRKAPAAVTITTENKRRRKVPTRFVPGVDEQQVVFTDADANEEAELETNILPPVNRTNKAMSTTTPNAASANNSFELFAQLLEQNRLQTVALLEQNRIQQKEQQTRLIEENRRQQEAAAEENRVWLESLFHPELESSRTNAFAPATSQIGASKHINYQHVPKYTTPAYSGVLKDDKIDYDTWVARSKRYLSGWEVPEKEKVKATLMTITSPAIDLLQPKEHQIRSVIDIYEILKPFQIIDKFRQLENMKQDGYGEESIQVLGVKITALVDSTCTVETRASRSLKYFINALRPEIQKKIQNSAPTTFEQAMLQAKQFEEQTKWPIKKEATVQLSQVQTGDDETQAESSDRADFTNKQYEAIKKQLHSLAKDVAQQHDSNNSNRSFKSYPLL